MERNHLEDIDVDGKDIKTSLGWRGVDWNALALDMERLRTLAYAVVNLRVTHNYGNFLTK